MSNARIKISADTGPLKKSLLEAKRAIENLNKGAPKGGGETKKPKESVISQKEAEEAVGNIALTRENINKKLADSKKEMLSLFKQSQEISDEDEKQLEYRKKINLEYKKQAMLMRDLKTLEEFGDKPDGGGGEKGEGLGSKMLRFGGNLLKGALKAAGVYALGSIVRGTNRYDATVVDRVQLSALGSSDSMRDLDRKKLSQSGINEEMLIADRLRMATQFGGGYADANSAIQRLSFERAYGLGRGSTSEMIGGLRSSFGSDSQNAMMEIQASVIANNLTDGLEPYFKNLTSLLSEINESGFLQHTELTRIYTSLVKNGIRTPEQLNRAITGLNDAIKNPSGEQDAFLQTAFAQYGIGGKTLGGVRMAMGSGLMGLDKSSAEKEFGPEMVKSMEAMGLFKGPLDRARAILGTAKQVSGLSPDESFRNLKGSPEEIATKMSQLDALFQFLGAGRGEGLQFASLFEKFTSTNMSEEDFLKNLKQLQEGGAVDSVQERLARINTTLAGNTEVLSRNIENLVMALGEDSIFMKNIVRLIDAVGLTFVDKGVNWMKEAFDFGKDLPTGGSILEKSKRQGEIDAFLKKLGEKVDQDIKATQALIDQTGYKGEKIVNQSTPLIVISDGVGTFEP